MQQLLFQIAEIHQKNHSKPITEHFNLFSILRNRSDEVYLHSKFIGEFLNPEGSHGNGNTFLHHFLEICGLASANFEGARIFREHKKIDLLIKSGKSVVIIENKIWAPDQKKQLERYFNIMQAEGATDIYVFYLTLDGRAPNAFTLGSLDRNTVKTLSYKHDIQQWLDRCLHDVVDSPSLTVTIKQYKNIVDQLTGNSMSDKEINEVVELLKSNGNILSAAKIVESWDQVKIKTEWNFWKELKETIISEGQYSIIPPRKVTYKKVKDAVLKSRNRDIGYGIALPLTSIEDETICLFIQRGKNDLYYGITVLDVNGDRQISSSQKYLPLAQSIASLNDKKDSKWVGRKYFNDPINFKVFNNESTLKLIEPEFRQKYVAKLWEEIKEYISACDAQNNLTTKKTTADL